MLLQHLDDLLFGKSALAHVRLPKERTLPKFGDIYAEQVTTATTQPLLLAQRNENPAGGMFRNENPGGGMYKKSKKKKKKKK